MPRNEPANFGSATSSAITGSTKPHPVAVVSVGFGLLQQETEEHWVRIQNNHTVVVAGRIEDSSTGPPKAAIRGNSRCSG